MERYAIIIKTDGVCVLLHWYHGDCLSLEEMQKIVEGHIQAVPTALAQGWSQEPGVGLALIVNEEGKLLHQQRGRLLFHHEQRPAAARRTQAGIQEGARGQAPGAGRRN